MRLDTPSSHSPSSSGSISPSLFTGAGTNKQGDAVVPGRKMLRGGYLKPQKNSRSSKGRGEVTPPTLCPGGRSDSGFREDVRETRREMEARTERL